MALGGTVNLSEGPHYVCLVFDLLLGSGVYSSLPEGFMGGGMFVIDASDKCG